MPQKVFWPGTDNHTTQSGMINNNTGRGQYGSLPTASPDDQSSQPNGAAAETAIVRQETSGSLATFGTVQQLYKKEIDWVLVAYTGRVLMVAALLALLIAIAVTVGAFISASVSLFVIVSCLLAVFARQIFLVFLLSVAGVSTIRFSYYQNRKIQLLVSLCANLLAFLVLGGSLYLSVYRLITKNYGSIGTRNFLITSSIALPFVAILCGLLSQARKLDDQYKSSSKKSTRTRKPQQKAALVSGVSRFSKERGLILRRSLNRVSIRSSHYLSLVLLLQALVVFLASLIAYFKPHTLVSDPVIALTFTPLAVVMAVSLIWDVISVTTEGILQGVDFGEIAESLINIDGVTAVRHLRIWSMKTDQVSLSVQIAIDDKANFDTVLRKANDLLKTKYDIYQYKIDSTDNADTEVEI